jgi:hypothetical protein
MDRIAHSVSESQAKYASDIALHRVQQSDGGFVVRAADIGGTLPEVN